MVTFHALPLTLHQFAPACWASPANQPGSLLENVVRYFFGSFCRTCWATCANSAQVFGTVRPSWVNRSAR
jgi:hypothetical protein